ncbi:MAG: hypothetical protein A2V90_03510 [Gammaproteobacteria bacterium RBG_16_57_12]|nr:MAG: hypothetical protein A2V90_03510 [Gammaproteobacteria bacterium RBG_16_57_12]
MNVPLTLSLQQAAQAMTGTLYGPDARFAQVSTDTRTLAGGELFIALRGERFDGHEYIAQAAGAGAVAVVVDHRMDNPLPQIVVQDTRLALGRLANAWRKSLKVSVVAVTGSNGKTTTKEMLAAILGTAGPVLATQGNLNNNIGVPLTLLRLQPEHCYAVIEMGANHHGEIAYLTNLTQPDVAMITNASTAHLAGFGDVQGVARAKGEIYQGLDEAGVAVVNADDAHAGLWQQLAHGHCTLCFGLDQPADVTASWEGDAAGSRVRLHAGDSHIDIQLPLPGRHNVLNALGAATAALALGIDLPSIKRGLEGMRAVPGRVQRKAGIHGSAIIDDTYNANPASLNAALAVLADCPGEKYLALGDMGELGEQASQFHEMAGKQARLAGVDRLYATGALSRAAVAAFGGQGRHFASQGEMIAALRQDLHAQATLLVKGSRASHMERVVQALSQEQEAAGHAALPH